MAGDSPKLQTRQVAAVHVLWTLTNCSRIAQAVTREWPHGPEVRIELDGVLVTSGLFPDDPQGLARFSDGIRGTFLGEGWTTLDGPA